MNLEAELSPYYSQQPFAAAQHNFSDQRPCKTSARRTRRRKFTNQREVGQVSKDIVQVKNISHGQENGSVNSFHPNAVDEVDINVCEVLNKLRLSWAKLSKAGTGMGKIGLLLDES